MQFSKVYWELCQFKGGDRCPGEDFVLHFASDQYFRQVGRIGASQCVYDKRLQRIKSTWGLESRAAEGLSGLTGPREDYFDHDSGALSH